MALGKKPGGDGEGAQTLPRLAPVAWGEGRLLAPVKSTSKNIGPKIFMVYDRAVRTSEAENMTASTRTDRRLLGFDMGDLA